MSGVWLDSLNQRPVLLQSTRRLALQRGFLCIDLSNYTEFTQSTEYSWGSPFGIAIILGSLRRLFVGSHDGVWIAQIVRGEIGAIHGLGKNTA